jgi:N-acetylglucosamine kinase-like BadF-type ATPase
MKEITRIKLKEAMDYCDDNDKSTIFMIQYMQDFAGVSHDCVINFLEKESKKSKEVAQ